MNQLRDERFCIDCDYKLVSIKATLFDRKYIYVRGKKVLNINYLAWVCIKCNTVIYEKLKGIPK